MKNIIILGIIVSLVILTGCVQDTEVVRGPIKETNDTTAVQPPDGIDVGKVVEQDDIDANVSIPKVDTGITDEELAALEKELQDAIEEDLEETNFS